MKKVFFQVMFLLIVNGAFGQILFFVIPGLALGATVMPEHGFLPGKKFRFYPTIDKYDLSNLKLRIEVYDDRPEKKLNKVQCSELEFTNTSEFADPDCIYMVGQYLDTLLQQSGAKVDSTSTDTLQIRFEGLDARMIGFGYIRAHGLCQMKMKYHHQERTYCVDITDADKHSPVGKNALVTRKTATRIIGSAAVREVIEQFFKDLKSYD